jgi:hypothetical protein
MLEAPVVTDGHAGTPAGRAAGAVAGDARACGPAMLTARLADSAIGQ